jgi:hypothetical protein
VGGGGGRNNCLYWILHQILLKEKKKNNPTCLVPGCNTKFWSSVSMVSTATGNFLIISDLNIPNHYQNLLKKKGKKKKKEIL